MERGDRAVATGSREGANVGVPPNQRQNDVRACRPPQPLTARTGPLRSMEADMMSECGEGKRGRGEGREAGE